MDGDYYRNVQQGAGQAGRQNGKALMGVNNRYFVFERKEGNQHGVNEHQLAHPFGYLTELYPFVEQGALAPISSYQNDLMVHGYLFVAEFPDVVFRSPKVEAVYYL